MAIRPVQAHNRAKVFHRIDDVAEIGMGPPCWLTSASGAGNMSRAWLFSTPNLRLSTGSLGLNGFVDGAEKGRRAKRCVTGGGYLSNPPGYLGLTPGPIPRAWWPQDRVEHHLQSRALD